MNSEDLVLRSLYGFGESINVQRSGDKRVLGFFCACVDVGCELFLGDYICPQPVNPILERSETHS